MKKAKVKAVKKERKLRALESFKPEDRKDIEAVRSVLAGNKAAYRRILERYRPFLVQRIFLKVKDLDTSQDIAADILWKIYEKLDKYQTTFTFNAWFFMVADNYLIDWARKHDRADRKMDSYDRVGISADGDEMQAPEELMKDKEASTDSATMMNERSNILLEALSSLDDDARMLIDMFYNKDMRYDEMSKRTGIPANTMKVILFRAKRKLADYFQREYPEFKMPMLESKALPSLKAQDVLIEGEKHVVYFA